MNKKLSRLKKHLSLNEKVDHGTQHHRHNHSCSTEPLNNTIPFVEQWAELGAKPFYFDNQYSLIREKVYPVNHQHGRYQFSELMDVAKRWEESKAMHPLSCKDNAMADMIFFDTETTGLSGGAGTYIFLLGYARILEDKVVVRQHFLPDPSCEVALYQGFLTEVGDSMNLVASYNGKAFDWPQVKTRHTLIRDMLPKLPSFGHFDLLHAARRLWKNHLPSCRLSVVEEEILHFSRQEDTPGYLAPMLYFEYLQEPDPEIVSGVLTHNEWDVCSLVSLYIHLSHLLINEHFQPMSQEEGIELGRWYEQVGEWKIAERFYRQHSRVEGSARLQAQHALALVLKKQGRWQEACDIWAQISREDHRYPIDVDVELAKLYEHKFKDIEQALFYACKALDRWRERSSLLRKTQGKMKTELLKRVERLEMKEMKNRQEI